MANAPFVPAAEYVRMSTEHQQYSIGNQDAAIRRYAAVHGFEIVQTYADPGKSGLALKHRPALASLLKDVLDGQPSYKAILVYDVSRWGRFQDSDEAAHYEFLCKTAGVPVHYCAEMFPNDDSFSSLVMKALKRAMAGEYSRELSVKVFDTQKRIVQNGYWCGGMAGYGLRRMMLSPLGDRNHLLHPGELKSIPTARVILVPGPSEEVQVVRDIFEMVVSERRSAGEIARTLNGRGIAYFGRKWTYGSVLGILKHPKYAGNNRWGQTTQRLAGPRRRVPRSQWAEAHQVFQPLVDQQTFDSAQRVLRDRTCFKSDEQLLDQLRKLLAEKGRLSENLIDEARGVAIQSTYRRRFGSLQRAYELIGFTRNQDYFSGRTVLRKQTQALRNRVLKQICHLYSGQVEVIKDGPVGRPRLQFHQGPLVCVLVSRWGRTPLGRATWCVNPVEKERHSITLLCRCTRENNDVFDYHLLPNIDRGNRFRLKERDAWLSRGEAVVDLSCLRALALQLRCLREEN